MTRTERKRSREGSILLIGWVVGGFFATALLQGQGISTFWAIVLGGWIGLLIGAGAAKLLA